MSEVSDQATGFSSLPLCPELLRAISDMGFTQPSPVQAETLPILLSEDTDFLGLAATGTGKTAAFALPLLEKIDRTNRSVQGLILCPTRELALQVAGQIDQLGKYLSVRSVAIYGGAPYAEQLRGLRAGATIVVGTPGRVVDHIERGTLHLDGLHTLILDEADEMISMGFKDELEKILEAVSTETCNKWLFSATMSREVKKVSERFLENPKSVQVNRKDVLSSTVEQIYYATHESNKPEVLCKLIETAEDFYGLIFCQTKSLVVELTQYLSVRGYKVDCLHGDKDQAARERTMRSFREKTATILICTDVASRGLDVKDVTHVINYSLPREIDVYVHRIGRTARSGKSGIAMNLVTPSHRRLIYLIESHTKSRMREGTVPSRREIGTRKVSSHLEAFKNQNFHARAVEVMGEDWKTALAGMSAEEVAGRFLNMMMPEIFNDQAHERAKPTEERRTFRDESERPMRPQERSSERPVRPFGRPSASRGPGHSDHFSGRQARPALRAERSERPTSMRPDRGPRPQSRREFDSEISGRPRPRPRFAVAESSQGERPMNRRERRALKFAQAAAEARPNS